MAVYQFYALIQKDEEDGGYIVTFPDLDNCFTSVSPFIVSLQSLTLDHMLDLFSCQIANKFD